MQNIAPFPLSVCGIEELTGHCETGVSHVLSILDPDHPEPEAFGRFGEHAKLELRFDDIIEPTAGKIAPDAGHAEAILGFGRALQAEPAPRLLVHCHAGISRSTASMALILAQARPELPAATILQGILGIREKAWPNLRLLELGDAMLGRGGSLPAAAAALYCHQLRIRPHLVEVMRRAGRGREVDAAATAVLPD
ncbi:MAG: protein-tyrosine-phosphatase [Belnapia sp.]|nr:protein-tyrosine-phosphatase [Belnapia sp.]